MRKFFAFFLIAAFFCLNNPNKIIAQVNIQDSLALVAFYNSTSGPTTWYHRDNWETAAPVSTWYGVTVFENRVTRLSLYNNYMSGHFPKEFGNLTELNYLFLGTNSLTGNIPAELGNLNKLTYLHISNNHLTGRIPSSFGNLRNLQYLELGSNSLSGTIPASLGKLINLQYLSLSYNKLSGSIPIQLGKLTNVQNIFLVDNQLTGSIPQQLGKLSNLQGFYVYHNQLSGIIPPELGQLSNLLVLYLGYNQLSGNIPTELGNISGLKQLYLQNNQLSGTIPITLGNLSKLYTLDLEINQLTGKIPSSLGNLSSLVDMRLDGNKLNGSIPSSFSNLFNLLNLSLESNKLNGTIPLLTNASRLNAITLYQNRFTFDGMDSLAYHFPFANYGDQAKIKLNYNGNTLSVSAGGTLANNTYTWYKDRKLYQTKTGDSILTVNETGSYYVIVTNSIATKLELQSTKADVSVLPLTMLSFNVAKQNKNVLLQWVTAQEKNTNYFEIERSINGTRFLAVGKVNATGSLAKNNYSFTDDITEINQQTSTVFYRLKSVDNDGAFYYSETRNVDLNVNLQASLYPNPATANTTISFNAAGKYTVSITDVSGKVLQTISGISNADKNIVQLNVNKYSSGIYFIIINDEKHNRQLLKLNKK